MTNTTPDDAGCCLDEYDGPRFWAHVSMQGGTDYLTDPLSTLGADAGECWTWSGWESSGYGRFNIFGATMAAHHIGFMEFGGEVPAGHVLDHLCRNAQCVRHNHLEPVTQEVNVSRGKNGRANKTRCPSGHEYTAENTKIDHRGGKTVRRCAACRKAYARKVYLRRQAA